MQPADFKPPFRWNEQKDELLQVERGVGFRDVVEAIEQGQVLDLFPHPKRDGQYIAIVVIGDYVYVVPAVREEKGWFFKTIYPSRKARKRYGHDDSTRSVR